VISGVDTNHRQLVVYRRNGDVLWDADLGSAALCVEAAEGHVLVGAANGYVHCFDASGGSKWQRFLVAPAVALAPAESGCCHVGLRNGSVFTLDAGGQIVASCAGEPNVTAGAWAKLWPGGGLLVGDERSEVAYWPDVA